MQNALPERLGEDLGLVRLELVARTTRRGGRGRGLGRRRRDELLQVTTWVIAGGMLFTTSGYATWGGEPGNVLLAFSVDGK